MGAILKGIQSVLIALGIIAVIGTGVILYYNTVSPEEEQTVSLETQPGTESDLYADTGEETGTDTEEAADTENTEDAFSDDTSQSVFSAESGHEHTYTTSVLRPATCTETGEMKYTCYCGDSYVDSIPVLDHTPGQWITVRSATSTQTGLRQRSCTVCGRVIEEDTLPMLPADTTATAATTSTKKDDDKDSTDNHRHSYTYEITEEASCTEKGEKTYTCTTCGSTFETSIPATNHPSRKTVRTEGDCGNPGKIEIVCNICDAVISSETLHYDHEWGSWTTTVAATTTSRGERTRTCKNCGETQTKSISRLSGSSSGSSGTNNGSSGTNNGSSGTNNGSGGTNNGSTDPNHKHTYTSSVTTPATCDEAGVTTYRCTCGDTYTEALPEALGHKPSLSWVTTVKATETEAGERVQYCSRCGAVAASEVIAPLEPQHTHRYSEVITRQPTCTTSGTLKHSCSCGYYYTSSIPKLGHRAGEEQTEGNNKVRRCKTCGIIMETQPITSTTPDPDPNPDP